MKKISEHHEGPLRSCICLMFCVLSISLDPLFFFVTAIDYDKNCIALDKKLAVTVLVLRSISDLYTSLQLRTPDHARKVGWRWFCYHVVHLLAVLPLPQVVIIIIIATMRGSKSLSAMKFLKYSVLYQYVPRLLRIYPLFKKATRTLGILPILPKVFHCLLMMVAGHVYGALWYFLAIEQELKCWNNACKSHTGCIRDPIGCNESSKNYVFLNDFCSTVKMVYDCGIFHVAVPSRILGSKSFLHKFWCCFAWGLQGVRYIYKLYKIRGYEVEVAGHRAMDALQKAL